MHSTLQDIELWHREEDSNINLTKKKQSKRLCNLRVPPLRHEIVTEFLFEAQLFARMFTPGGQALEKVPCLIV